MGVEWPHRSIAECAAEEPYSTQIGPFGKALMAEEYVQRGVPVLRGVNVNRGRFHDDDFVFIDDKTADRLSKFESLPGDVLLVHKGTLGQIGLMPRQRRYPRYIMGNSMMRVRCDPNKLLPEYLYYWLSSSSGQHYLWSRVSQVGVPQLQTPLTTLRAAVLPVPPIAEQRGIVQVLGSLDDKIELNRRLNETLEASARALFKSWFVDFDPVADNATGRDALTEHWVAELYPADLKESPLGAIPTTWTTGRISDLCTTQYGYTASAEDRPVGPKFLRVMDVNKHPWIEWGTVPHCRVGNDDREKYGLRVGDIVVARMADPGKAAVVEEPVDAVFASYLVRLKTSTLSDAYFLYGFLKSKHYADYALAARGGSVQANMNARVIVDCPLPLPPQPVRAAYLEVVLPLRQRLCASVRESALLAIVRDALLPKLLSGELRPKDAGRQVEAVV